MSVRVKEYYVTYGRVLTVYPNCRSRRLSIWEARAVGRAISRRIADGRGSCRPGVSYPLSGVPENQVAWVYVEPPGWQGPLEPATPDGEPEAEGWPQTIERLLGCFAAECRRLRAVPLFCVAATESPGPSILISLDVERLHDEEIASLMNAWLVSVGYHPAVKPNEHDLPF